MSCQISGKSNMWRDIKAVVGPEGASRDMYIVYTIFLTHVSKHFTEKYAI